ncbi:MAG TPA: VOC family protein [Egibacteraceae bacterium]|nr:VOC family protein [Egibacteraceae bacterium]
MSAEEWDARYSDAELLWTGQANRFVAEEPKWRGARARAGRKAPAGEQLSPYLSIEVGDVDSVHANALERGYEVVHPLTDESWGVRRFFVREPGGLVLNILGHTPLGEVPGGGGRGRAQGAGGRP